MEPQTVRKLEAEIAEAIAVTMLRRSKGWEVPLLPSQRTMHLMAKAAVTVYEAAVQEHRTQPEYPGERGPDA